MLLCHVKGATSFADLRTFEGQAFGTFKEACAARGLLDDDKMHDEILADAVTHQMPRQLRHTFALLLLWDEPREPYELWKKYEADLAEDFLHEARQVKRTCSHLCIYQSLHMHALSHMWLMDDLHLKYYAGMLQG